MKQLSVQVKANAGTVLVGNDGKVSTCLMQTFIVESEKQCQQHLLSVLEPWTPQVVTMQGAINEELTNGAVTDYEVIENMLLNRVGNFYRLAKPNKPSKQSLSQTGYLTITAGVSVLNDIPFQHALFTN